MISISSGFKSSKAFSMSASLETPLEIIIGILFKYFEHSFNNFVWLSSGLAIFIKSGLIFISSLNDFNPKGLHANFIFILLF